MPDKDGSEMQLGGNHSHRREEFRNGLAVQNSHNFRFIKQIFGMFSPQYFLHGIVASVKHEFG